MLEAILEHLEVAVVCVDRVKCITCSRGEGGSEERVCLCRKSNLFEVVE